MMTCEACREQLSALLDDMLDESERERVQSHVNSCQACAEELEALRRTSRALLELDEQPPEEFSQDWRRAIREQAEVRQPGAKRRWFAMRQVGMVAAALVVAVTVWQIWPIMNGNSSARMLKSEQAAPAPAPEAAMLASPQIMADNAAPEASAAGSAEAAGDQARIMMEETPAQASATAAAEAPAAKAPAEKTPAAAEPNQTNAASVDAVPQESLVQNSGTGGGGNYYAAEDGTVQGVAQGTIEMGTVTISFANVDAAIANAIVIEALNRMAITGSASNNTIDVPVLTAVDSTQLLENIRTVAAEQNVSNVSIVCEPNNTSLDITQILVVVK